MINAGIVGGGVMGKLLAYEFIKAGHHVTLHDPIKDSHAPNCSMVASGLLTPFTELVKSPIDVYHLGKEALALHWPRILNDLDPSGNSIYFKENGCLAVSHPTEFSELENDIQVIHNKLALSHGDNDDDSITFYKRCDDKALIALEPELGKFSKGFYFPQEAHVDNQSLIIKLSQYLKTQGVQITTQWVDDILPYEIIIGGQSKRFDCVFDCRGLGAQQSLPNLMSIRGEVIWLQAPDVTINRPICFQHPRYRIYIVPRPNDIYILGASEIHTENYDPISVQTMLELLSAAYYVHPGFSQARILKTLSQCRPTFPDYGPKITVDDGLISINGLYRHGFLVAPTLASRVSDLFKIK